MTTPCSQKTFMQEIQDDVKDLKTDVRKLLAFRSYLLGAIAVISFMVTLLVNAAVGFTKDAPVLDSTNIGHHEPSSFIKN